MRRVLCLVLLLVTVSGAVAVVSDMKFRRLDTRDGLSNAQVNDIYRDSRGFVWIATPYGLNRYDGYRIRTYYSQSKDTTTLLRSNIDEVQEDANGKLWLRHGTYYSVFDPASECSERHPEQWLREYGIRGSVERLYIDKQKNFWIKTYDEGFWFLNPRSRQTRHFPVGEGSQQMRSDFSVSDFLEYGKSLMAVSNNGDIVCFHKAKQTVSWQSRRLREMHAPKNAGYTLHIDKLQNIWVLVEGDAFVFLRQQGRWVKSAREALTLMGVTGLPQELIIWNVVSDRHGLLWFATDHEGLCVVDLTGRQMHQFLNVKNDETTISDNTLRKIYCDQLGRMWIATYMNGVNYYADNLFDFKHLPLGNVNTLVADKQGYCWAGTNEQGIIRYQFQTGERTMYNKANSGLGSDIIVSSLLASDGTLWFGTYEGGLIRCRDGKFTCYRAKGDPQGLVHDNVWAISEDQDGNIWIGTLGGGLQRIDHLTGKFTTLNQENSGLASNYISSIQQTADGRLLVGHTEFYSLVDTKAMTVENKRIEEQNDNPVTANSNMVMQDSRGMIWQGAASGVTVCDLENNRTYLLDMKSGLIGSTVNSITEDRQHTMWVVTEHGISHVTPQRDEDGKWTFLVYSYNNRDGLQDGTYNQRAVTVAPDGRLLVGGHSGIDIVDPQHMGQATLSQEIPLFSGVKVMEGNYVNVAGQLRLKYSDNQFTIQLCSNSGEVHNRARFAYRLKGLSDHWRYTDDVNPEVTYMGLPSGHYTLYVRMLKKDGTLGETEIELPVVIDAPWYRSWWMWMCYMLCVAMAFYWYYRRIQEKLRLEKLKLERENTHRIDELKQKFADTINEELRMPFQQTFESLNAMMQRESDEQRYEQQQQVFSHVESLLEEVSKLADNVPEKAKLKPQIRELEIVSLDEKLVKAATDYVENNLDNADISVETMAEELGMSRVHLYKKLTAITDLTPSEFIRQIRLRHAEQLLSKSQLTVAEVAYKVGFNNPRYLSKYFKEMYGVMPSEYKNRQKNETDGD